jgi:hypothetical protein
LLRFAQPLAHVPARVPEHAEPHVGGVHGGGRAGGPTRRRVRASRKTSGRPVRASAGRFPRPGRVSSRGARRGSHLGRRIRGVDHPAGREPGRHPRARPENVTRRSGNVPGVRARPAPNVPSREEHPGAPGSGRWAEPASSEAAVWRKRAFARGAKIHPFFFFSKSSKIWCRPTRPQNARRARADPRRTLACEVATKP